MFFEIGETEITKVLSYASGIFSDGLPLVLLFCGVLVGMYILAGLTNNNSK